MSEVPQYRNAQQTSFPRTRVHPAIESYRVTSLIRNSRPLGPYSRTMPRALRWSYGGGQFLLSEVPLQIESHAVTLRRFQQPAAFASFVLQ